MPIRYKSNGQWGEIQNVYVKESGSWRSVSQVYRKVNGSWLEIFAVNTICRYAYSYNYTTRSEDPDSATNRYTINYERQNCASHSGCCGSTTTCQTCCSPSCSSKNVSWTKLDGSNSGSGCYDQSLIDAHCGITRTCSIGSCCGADSCTSCNCTTSSNTCTECCSWGGAFNGSVGTGCLTIAGVDGVYSSCYGASWAGCSFNNNDRRYRNASRGGVTENCTPSTYTDTPQSGSTGYITDEAWVGVQNSVRGTAGYVNGSLTSSVTGSDPDNGSNC